MCKCETCAYVLRNILYLFGLAQAIDAFFGCLSDKFPDLSRLSTISEDIAVALSSAEATYVQLLQTAPHSAPAMRSYASFLLE